MPETETPTAENFGSKDGVPDTWILIVFGTLGLLLLIVFILIIVYFVQNSREKKALQTKEVVV